MVSLAAAIVPSSGRRATTGPETVRDTLWFSGLYEETVDNVYRYAYVLMRNADQAEDVTADAFLRAWRSRHNLRSESSAQAWLLSITHNSAMSLLRSNREVAGLDALSVFVGVGALTGQFLLQPATAGRPDGHAAAWRRRPETA